MQRCWVPPDCDGGLGRQGWLAWERFRCNIDCDADPRNCIREELFQQMAERLVRDGYRAAGYEYVGIDDCWMAGTRDGDGRMLADPERFPSGIKALADFAHARGLKLGLYSDIGLKTVRPPEPRPCSFSEGELTAASHPQPLCSP